jgi:hypothetical protein
MLAEEILIGESLVSIKKPAPITMQAFLKEKTILVLSVRH